MSYLIVPDIGSSYVFLFPWLPKSIVYKTVLLCAFLNLLTFIFFKSPFQSCLPPFSSLLCSQGQTQCLPFFFSPLLLLQSSCRLPCTNYAHIPAGFRCKSYLNLSPAAMRAARGMEQNRPPGYRSNLQNEHGFVLWDIGA